MSVKGERTAFGKAAEDINLPNGQQKESSGNSSEALKVVRLNAPYQTGV